ncbi:hypothetical protein [Streptomyces sp. SID8499]|uniref:hypothetical protein n=1 Tax=Streptomyces sp. SID8499 TaxID=2706106 RepID=UPI0013C5DFB9|nr:hypothetical protein [Streptomyces sp. SID8499]NED31027.1 hypothetical protein [Streptomyces sp. SID8499]
MSITQDLRTRRKHRGKTPWQLVQTIGRLEREADAATCQMVAMATEIDGLKAANARLEADFDQAAIDYSTALDDLRQARDENDRLAAELAAMKATEANATAVTVPPMVRDTSVVEDQATGPIDVRALWEARDAGLLGPVLDPGRP